MKSSDSRLRRGCVTDGHEITDNSEAQPKAGQLFGNTGILYRVIHKHGGLTIKHYFYPEVPHINVLKAIPVECDFVTFLWSIFV